ncbi:MAG: S46 family peptidase [Deltaproteobacteria bacterium]|nr:S46 family peptidase [Deltaproteobacteria bacterium]MDQ3298048.1 S46 family peptidase [Myxococcota bacterium]
MQRNGILCGLLLAAACSGGSKTQNTGGTLGSTHDQGTTTTTSDGTTMPAKVDPNLAFRQQYSNAGGMWMPQQMTLPGHTDVFQKMGVRIDAKVLADPLSAPLAAVVSLGGCTGSFVSPDGLVVTNHHCVQGALQFNATPESNLVEAGFLAKTRADEKSAGPAQRVFVAQAFKDVTKEMRDGLDAIKDPNKRKTELETRMKQLVAACEKDRPGIRCNVSGFFRGGQYIQIENLEIRDVRLVYVPARSVGNYGGEIDNWAWPRHTGDWAFYRAYVGKDGKPADFSADNVPFRPKHHIKVTSAGLKPGDFVMVTGYPGSTSRTDTASETRHDVEWFYPYYIAYLKERYALVESHLKDGGETAIKATVMKQGVQNGLEKYQGVLKGLTSGDLLQRKDALDKQVKEWAAKPGNEQHKAAIERLEKLLIEEQRTARADFDRGITFGGSKLLGTALGFTRWAEERAKKDPERKPGYQDRDMARAMAGQKQFAKGYDRTLDRSAFRLSLTRAANLPEAERPWLATLLGVKKGTKINEALIDKTLDSWYGAQQLEDEKVRMELLTKGTTKQMKASKDPFVQAAQRIWPIVKAEEKKSDAKYADIMLVTPFYADAMRQVLGGLLAPDANSTLRITYGTVKPFKANAKDPADWPFTLASQILAKDTGKEPFDMPKQALEAIKAKKYGPYADAALGGELAVDFLSDVDITGGNSGSPTLNDKGELVGLAFDGTLEGVASDVVFNGTTTRTISVDARYMLWHMDLLDGADHLITEMGLQPKL